ncbi:hypothetical protein EDEG_02157 [Edhazardia aedis USNM 41457]|uniref:Uncharacterized protein n=1 Tax=Edhazardia aedis (strain USNM 41457) TaxID=1003232 RepID=J9D6U7_EDHAE|nr:hypothetical protein EDEG_02157 [Edhazardia aedis USNM 41457]|eukprot:EJW03501.1 hypothetical protein EDEG_02157 [Edhazardia aedis USNM 41457]
MFFLINLISANNFFVRLLDTEKYISGDQSKETPLHLVSRKNADSINFRSDQSVPENVYITSTRNPTLSWKYNTDNSQITYSRMMDSKSFVFRVVPIDFYNNVYWIGNDIVTNCLTWDDKEIKLVYKECDLNNKKQMWQVIKADIGAGSHEVHKAGVDEEESTDVDAHPTDDLSPADVEKSHKLEWDGEALISGIVDLLKDLDGCLKRTGSCISYEEALGKFIIGSTKKPLISKKFSTMANGSSYKSTSSSKRSFMSASSSREAYSASSASSSRI